MRERPILFNTEMVKAILDGRKSCTRRIVKHDVEAILNSPYHRENPDVEDKQIISKLCMPPYQPGDILYVRETWQKAWLLDDFDCVIDGTEKYYYAAGPEIPCFGFWVDPETGKYKDRMPWKPSIHMPKEAARIWLHVTEMRVERLRDITEVGAINEGCIDDIEYAKGKSARNHFVDMWNNTIKKSDLDKYGWSANPWVWVIEFERCEKPGKE